jgi:hypothetical protein
MDFVGRVVAGIFLDHVQSCVLARCRAEKVRFPEKVSGNDLNHPARPPKRLKWRKRLIFGLLRLEARLTASRSVSLLSDSLFRNHLWRPMPSLYRGSLRV